MTILSLQGMLTISVAMTNHLSKQFQKTESQLSTKSHHFSVQHAIQEEQKSAGKDSANVVAKQSLNAMD